MKGVRLLIGMITLLGSFGAFSSEELPIEVEHFQESVGSCKIIKYKPGRRDYGKFDFAIFEAQKTYRISKKAGFGIEKSVRVLNRRGQQIEKFDYDSGKANKVTYLGSYEAHSKGMRKIKKLCRSRS